MKNMIPDDSIYQKLLAPCKDPAKSFEIDLAQVLFNYIKCFVEGNIPINFNSAALLLQGSSHVYGKKVEYLHNLALQLYRNLTKKKKDDTSKKDPVASSKKKENKEGKFNDPFFPTEIKLGKHLSCLKRRNANKNAGTSKKLPKRTKKFAVVPVNLLPFEGEEKGEVFYDTYGDPIGNKGDYTLNKCKVSTTGWILLPTINLDQIPTDNSTSRYSLQVESNNHCEENDDVDHDMPLCTPDEGFEPGSEPPSQPIADSSPEIALSQQTDEGLGSISSTPAEMGSKQTENASQPVSQFTPDEPMEGLESGADPGLPDAEAIPDLPLDEENVNIANKSVRRSMRQAEKLQADETKDASVEEEKSVIEELPVVKKAIQKRNTCNLPTKLKSFTNDSNSGELSIDEFCARTFFSVDNKFLKNGLSPIETKAFKKNSSFLRKLQERHEALKASVRKNKKTEDDDEEEDENIEVDIETFNDPEPDDMIMPTPLEGDDIVISNNLDDMPIPEPAQSAPPSRDISQTDAPPLENGIMDDDNIYPEQSQNEPDAEDIRSHNELERNAEISAKVKEWQDQLLPFLESLKKREEFDINLYGGKILDSFEEPISVGKQRKETKTFREICRGMEKWQIHRYFMALLPLANMGNVELESEERPNGHEEILITLLSKKMHWLKLEEFDSDANRKNSQSNNSRQS